MEFRKYVLFIFSLEKERSPLATETGIVNIIRNAITAFGTKLCEIVIFVSSTHYYQHPDCYFLVNFHLHFRQKCFHQCSLDLEFHFKCECHIAHESWNFSYYYLFSENRAIYLAYFGERLHLFLIAFFYTLRRMVYFCSLCWKKINEITLS